MSESVQHAPAPTTFGTNSYRQIVVCRVCGRSLLLGERSTGFFNADGSGPFDVCELCVPRAHKFGLQPQQSTSDELSRGRGARRRRMSLPPSLGLPRLRRTAREKGDTAPREPRRRSARAVRRTEAALGTAPVGLAATPFALSAFNSSSHARTLAGLHRTLGPPRASVEPRSSTDREVILTVAWEIVWYQFRIMPDGIEQGRGTYLSDLDQRWQHWNCAVAPDGTVRETGEFHAPSGQHRSEGLDDNEGYRS